MALAPSTPARAIRASATTLDRIADENPGVAPDLRAVAGDLNDIALLIEDNERRAQRDSTMNDLRQVRGAPSSSSAADERVDAERKPHRI